MTARSAMKAGQPWYSLGMFLVLAGILGHFLLKQALGAVGDLIVGVAMGAAIVFLIVALVKIRKAKAEAKTGDVA